MIDIFICFYLFVRVWWICANVEANVEANQDEINPNSYWGLLLFIFVSVAKFWNWNYRSLFNAYYEKKNT